MQKKIKSALISVFYKDGLLPVLEEMKRLGITIYSTGGTQKFIEEAGMTCIPVENLTGYPSILGGRVKTLHPAIFGGILGRRKNEQDMQEMKQFNIPEIDLVIIDLYPFEETLAHTSDEKTIIEKIDIGGPSLIRAAAKNFEDMVVVAAKDDYQDLEKILREQEGNTTLAERKSFAAKAFEIVFEYDLAIRNYFNGELIHTLHPKKTLRYGENPHQQATFYGNLENVATQIHGKELSYNNLVDSDAAISIITEFKEEEKAVFAIIKHTNVCGIAKRESLKDAWDAALAGDPESAFGGVLVCNKEMDETTAASINELFFEVLIATGFDEKALQILQSKKNRILLVSKKNIQPASKQYKSILHGTLVQDTDITLNTEWNEVGGRIATAAEKEDLIFANIICKHLKSNAISIVKNLQLCGKGCGQTSRVDAVRQAIEKAKYFQFDLNGAVLASDAFFPFDDSVRLAHAVGVSAFIQPGGSIRDKDSIQYCVENKLPMVLTGTRHFRH
ncbi:MAG: bifunctional phosphoribosylaminoimidazolecarboxamide formyltransferase/IMP cyclohydrolase [Bacteroidetes bacterium]|nr:bifunctional phosphoribosylaminoimidazolecarboxamide formyltransferase/IMP cyclohydrolase [Bacteroidota bacterium]